MGYYPLQPASQETLSTFGEMYKTVQMP
jgi:hypothetical protein